MTIFTDEGSGPIQYLPPSVMDRVSDCNLCCQALPLVLVLNSIFS